MYIILVRNSESDSNNKSCHNDYDAGISKNGHKCARDIAKKLSNDFDCTDFKIISSPLKRAVETADTFKSIIKIDSKISREYRIIDGITKLHYFSGDLMKNMDKIGIVCPESIENIMDRISAMVEELIAKEDNSIIFTHGIIFNCFMQYFFPKYEYDKEWNGDGKNEDEYFPPHCTYAIISIDKKNNKLRYQLINSSVNFDVDK